MAGSVLVVYGIKVTVVFLECFRLDRQSTVKAV